MRLYTDLASWFPLVTRPEEYAVEADHIVRLAEAACRGRPETLLELGSGAGNTASHLKQRFACMLTDISGDMLALSRQLNPECEHGAGDMRSLRVGRLFDVVLAHDALDYMTSEADLAAAIETAAAHVRPGGVAIFTPDAVTEIFSPRVETGGYDHPDGRRLRYLEWTREPDGSTYGVDYAFLIKQPGQPTRVVHDRHVHGLFPRATWLRLIVGAGLQPISPDVEDPYEGEHAVFAARKPG